ncbi:MAG: phosphonate ABC transporter, permease protein PhnE [Actinomycetota bacterium]|nr:phosphonate ABC transporter, permease protein PhnE [Actinomycetota bacterium]
MTSLDTAHAPEAHPKAPELLPRKKIGIGGWIGRAAWLVVTIAVILSVWHIDIEWSNLLDLPKQIGHYFNLMFLPVQPNVTGQALGAMVDSIQMAWVGTVIAAVISLPLAFLAASNLVPFWVRFVLRMVFNVIRAVPELVLAVLILSVTGLTPFTGALAIGIHSIGTLGKLTAEVIEDAPRGPMEAATAVGASWAQRIRTAVWPSVAPQIMSVWLYRFEVNIRASAVLGAIGAGGIGSMMSDYITNYQFPEVGMILIVLVVVTVLVDLLSGAVRTSLVTGRKPWDRWTRGSRGAATIAKASLVSVEPSIPRP